MSDQQASLDFAFLANAEVAGVAKQIIAHYYAKPAAYSYFVGCSTGGREGMILSQRYPTVFNGIVSGDPAMRTGLSNLAIAQWIPVAYNQAAPKDASGKPQIDKFLTDGDRKLFMDALMKQCDAKDGVADGMISDPLGCDFDPAVLACKPGQSDSCIAPEKIAAIKKAFAGPKNAYGTQVYPGFLYDAGIASKGFVSGPARLGTKRHLWPLHHRNRTRCRQGSAPCLRSARRTCVHQSLHVLAERRQADLLPRRQRSVVLAARHTWLLPIPCHSQRGRRARLPSGAASFLFPAWPTAAADPSLDHFDMLTAVVDWVEKGTPPDSVIATGQAFPGRSRPLCAYPKHAQYNGTGDTQDARNFQCQDSTRKSGEVCSEEFETHLFSTLAAGR